MAGQALTQASTMQCPHGGQVQAIPSNNRAKGDASLLTTADTFTIAGCAFTIPPGSPSPCLTVRWIVADLRVKAGSNATLSQGDTGLCLNAMNAPQGPVVISNTQSRVKTQ
jgi:hypothetical protein